MLKIILIVMISIFFIVSGSRYVKMTWKKDEYILGSQPLGIASGTVIILVYWVTGNTLLSSSEATYNLGILGNISYAFMGTIGLIFFAYVAKRLKKLYPKVRSIGDFYQQVYNSKILTSIVVLLVVFHSIGILVTQGIGGGLILEYSLGIPYNFGVFIVFLIATVYMIFGGFDSIIRVSLYQVVVILCVAMLIPPLLYFKIGIVDIYQSIEVRNIEKLNLLNIDGLSFLFSGALIGVGAVMMDNFFWQRTYAFKKEGLYSTFILSALIWIFIPLSFGSLTYIALANEISVVNINQLVPIIIDQYGGSVSYLLFLLAIWSALISTTAIILNSILGLFVYNVLPMFNIEFNSLKSLRLCIIALAIIGFYISIISSITMLEVLVFFSVFNVSVISPTLFSLFSIRIHYIFIILAILISSISGVLGYVFLSVITGIVISASFSFLICIMGIILSLVNNYINSSKQTSS